MKPLNLARLASALAACALLGTLVVGTASAAKPTAAAFPPNGVYTCNWITLHPAAAAQAQVTCDPAAFSVTMSAPAPIAGPSVAILASPDIIESTDCWNIPEGGGSVSPGVFAWSSFEYSNWWTWNANNAPNGPIDYTWYIQKPG